ncbi:MAG: hypothetical protein WCD42_08365, partial [Rhizomicrobium sp.]
GKRWRFAKQFEKKCEGCGCAFTIIGNFEYDDDLRLILAGMVRQYALYCQVSMPHPRLVSRWCIDT